MSKKTLNNIFNEKINKQEIKDNVLNKINKKSFNFLKIINVGKLVRKGLYLLVLGCLLLVFIFNQKKNITPEIYQTVDKTFESENLEELIQKNQYAFIGFVSNSCDKDNFYPVKVYENIKGKLIKSSNIKVKVDSFTLDVTKIYLFTAKVVNHDLIIEKEENANLLLDINSNKTNTDDYTISLSKEDEEKIKEIADEYRAITTSNEDSNYTTYDSKKEDIELSRYDVNYKE